MFKKKNGEIEEQMMQEISDEQLGQVTGGSLSGDGVGVPSTVSTTVTGLLNSACVNGMQVSVAGAGCSTPAVSTNGLIPGLF